MDKNFCSLGPGAGQKIFDFINFEYAILFIILYLVFRFIGQTIPEIVILVSFEVMVILVFRVRHLYSKRNKNKLYSILN